MGVKRIRLTNTVTLTTRYVQCLDHPFRRRDMQQQSESIQQMFQVLQQQRQARAQAQADALAEAQAGIQVLMQRARLRAWARKRWHKPQGWEAEAQAEALAEALARARAQAEVAQEQAQEVAQAQARTEALAALLGVAGFEGAHPVAYGEVLADSELMDIIYSMKPEHRHDLARIAWHLSEHWWFIQIIVPITRLPQELLHQIFLIIIDNASHSPLVLMRVSKHWYNIVTGIWASLKLGTATPRDAITKKLERNQWLLDVVVDTEIDRGLFTLSSGAYQAIFTAIQATPRWRSFTVESFPAQADLPEHLVNTGLQQCSDAAMSRLRTFKIKCPCEISPLLQRLLCMLGTTASEELTTIEINSPSVISFLAPTYPSLFHSVQDLCLDTPRLPNPVDLLPHLHQLEKLSASHLSLPIYHNDVDIPCVRTLRHLTLRAVSIQWMSGRTFDALESCTLLFPLHRHVLHTFSTNLPNCSDLMFQGYPLDILHGVSVRNLRNLSVMCPCPKKSQGSRQLARFSSHVLQENRLAPRVLHINIEATNQAWIHAFAFMSNLEELVIGSAQPSSLGVKVLQSFIIYPVHASNIGTTATRVGGYTLVCPSLKRFGLRYGRWLRPSEHFDLIPELVSIILSRKQSNVSLKSFRIWKGSDQQHPLELIEGSRISLKGFELLDNAEGGDLLQSVVSRLLEKMFKPCPLPHALKCK